jgi:2-aminoethylphosphonate-pyruvate transaminase
MIVDAVSAFGALPLWLSDQPEIEAAVFTANKCIEGMPGLAFVLARLDALRRAEPAGSWCFDLADLQRHADRASAFRFTPPVQVLAAFDVALDLHAAEGGQPARLARYTENARALYDAMLAIGLTPNLPRAVQGPIVLNTQSPDDPAWNLQAFVDRLKEQGFLISNFFDTPNPTFRVGCIGQVTTADMRDFARAVDRALDGLGVRNRGPARLAA